jgi:hypothetical protein
MEVSLGLGLLYMRQLRSGMVQNGCAESGGKSWPKENSIAGGRETGETLEHKKTPPSLGKAAFFSIMTRKEECFVLGRPGSDLLSQGLSHSTIGAEEFNGRVRDGIGFKLLARTTRPAKDKDTKQAVERDALGRMGSSE